jgi:cellulose biosynthesis protein BcsQ
VTTSTNLGWPSEPEPAPEHRRLGWLARMLGVSRETGGATAVTDGSPDRNADGTAQGASETGERGAPVTAQPDTAASTENAVATDGSTGSPTATGTAATSDGATHRTSGQQDEEEDESGSAAPGPEVDEPDEQGAGVDDGAQPGGGPVGETSPTQSDAVDSAEEADPSSADLGDADLNTELAAGMDTEVDPTLELDSATDPNEATDMVEAAAPDTEEPVPGGAPVLVDDQAIGSQEGAGVELPTPPGPVDKAVDEAARDSRTEREIAANRAGDNTVDGTDARTRFDSDHADREALAAALPTPGTDTPLAMELADNARRRIQLTGRQFPRPVSPRVLTVANQKGGVGKTTTTVNVAAALAQAGLKVLVIDLDPQGNASTALGIDHHAEVPSIYDVLVDGIPMLDVVQPCTTVENLHCAPATIDLAGAEIELVSLVARESRLQKAIAAAAEAGHEFDYILIDCPPSLGLLTVNAMVAASEVFIPIQCEYYALEGLSQLLKNIDLIKRHLNPTLHVSTILLTMYDGRTRLSAQVADEVREHFPEEVLRTTVPRSVRVSEAPSFGETVMTYDPASSGALAYLEAAGEIADRGAAGNT